MTDLDAQCATARDHIRAMVRPMFAAVAAWDLDPIEWFEPPVDAIARPPVVVVSCTMEPSTPIDPLLGHLP